MYAMKLSFATLGCPAWTIEQVARNARRMGFDGVELRGVAGEHIGPDETAASRAAIKRLFAEAGVEIACISGYPRFTWSDPARRENDIADAIKLIEVARDIGCPLLRIFGGDTGELDRNVCVRLVVESLHKIVPHAAKAGVTLALESHDAWCKGADLKAILDGVASNALGVCWDICNSHFAEPLATTYKIIGDAIVHVHFKDAGHDARNTLVSKLPGTGEVDMRQSLALLHSGRYHGYLSFEWEKKWEPGLAEPELAFPHFMQHSTALMRELGIPRLDIMNRCDR